MNVSHSKLSTFKQCPYKHYLKYVERLEPISIVKPLYKGSGIHSLLEMRAKNFIDPLQPTWEQYLDTTLQKAYEELSSSDKDSIGDFIEDARKIMRQYDWCYSSENLTYLEIEKWIEIPLIKSKGEPVILVGKVDSIVVINGDQYILEHKTYSKNPMSLQDAWVNIQTSIYAYALNKFYGYNIKGVLWDMVRSSPYEEPNILQSGRYGKQSSKVTLLSFKDDPGQDIIDQVKENHLNFLSRFITPIIPSAVEAFMKDSKVIAKMMKKQGDNIIRFKNLTRDCSWCNFKDICQTELTGGDVSYIKELLFRVKKDKIEEATEEVAEEE